MTNDADLKIKTQQVEKEGLTLLRLCEELDEYIQEGRSRKSYLFETETFINYIQKSINVVSNYVKELIRSLREDHIEHELIQAKLRSLGQIERVLSWLYTLTKDAIDADSLSIPFSLSTFINEKTKEIQGSKEVSLVILGTSDLNFYQMSLKKLRDLTLVLHSEIKIFEIFPNDIGLLLFPYSTAKQILVNCILFHEMGHFIYENTKLEGDFKGIISKELDQFLKNNPEIKDKMSFPLLAERYIFNYVWKLLRKWANEIFADIFAIRALGPAYHFAYLEMVQLIPTDLKERNRTFSDTHPADDYRFRMQGEWLKEGEWNEELKKRVPHIFDHLEICRQQTHTSIYKIKSNPPINDENSREKLHAWMLVQFNSFVEKIENKITEKLKPIEKPIVDFTETDKAVTTCLEHGIVPSSVYSATNEKVTHPRPTTLLNSGYFFYLTGMRNLLEKVKIESNSSTIDTQLFYMKRLNQWIAKGIEDWQIMETRKS